MNNRSRTFNGKNPESGSFGVILFVSGDLFGPPGVAAPLEVGNQPGLDHFLDLFLADEVGGQAHHVGIVVPAAEFGVDHVAAVGGADHGDFVRGDAHSVAGPANEDAAIDAARTNRFGNRDGVIGVVDARSAVGAEVVHFVTELLEQADQALLDGHSAMV